jgi:hypothetical protein
MEPSAAGFATSQSPAAALVHRVDHGGPGRGGPDRREHVVYFAWYHAFYGDTAYDHRHHAASRSLTFDRLFIDTRLADGAMASKGISPKIMA